MCGAAGSDSRRQHTMYIIRRNKSRRQRLQLEHQWMPSVVWFHNPPLTLDRSGSLSIPWRGSRNWKIPSTFDWKVANGPDLFHSVLLLILLFVVCLTQLYCWSKYAHLNSIWCQFEESVLINNTWTQHWNQVTSVSSGLKRLDQYISTIKVKYSFARGLNNLPYTTVEVYRKCVPVFVLS